MKRSPYRYLLPFLALFAALAIGIYFINPLAPLLLLLSLVVQLPLIFLITRVTLGSGYIDRSYQRREQYEKDKNAEAWLAGEEAEARGLAYKYYSKMGKMRCALNRAVPLALLGRTDEAAVLMAGVDPKRLSTPELARYNDTLALLSPIEKP